MGLVATTLVLEVLNAFLTLPVAIHMMLPRAASMASMVMYPASVAYVKFLRRTEPNSWFYRFIMQPAPASSLEMSSWLNWSLWFAVVLNQVLFELISWTTHLVFSFVKSTFQQVCSCFPTIALAMVNFGATMWKLGTGVAQYAYARSKGFSRLFIHLLTTKIRSLIYHGSKFFRFQWLGQLPKMIQSAKEVMFIGREMGWTYAIHRTQYLLDQSHAHNTGSKCRKVRIGRHSPNYFRVPIFAMNENDRAAKHHNRHYRPNLSRIPENEDGMSWISHQPSLATGKMRVVCIPYTLTFAWGRLCKDSLLFPGVVLSCIFAMILQLFRKMLPIFFKLVIVLVAFIAMAVELCILKLKIFSIRALFVHVTNEVFSLIRGIIRCTMNHFKVFGSKCMERMIPDSTEDSMIIKSTMHTSNSSMMGWNGASARTVSDDDHTAMILYIESAWPKKAGSKSRKLFIRPLSPSYFRIHENTIHECKRSSRKYNRNYSPELACIDENEDGIPWMDQHLEVASAKLRVVEESRSCRDYLHFPATDFSVIIDMLLRTCQIVQFWSFKLWLLPVTFAAIVLRLFILAVRNVFVHMITLITDCGVFLARLIIKCICVGCKVSNNDWKTTNCTRMSNPDSTCDSFNIKVRSNGTIITTRTVGASAMASDNDSNTTTMCLLRQNWSAQAGARFQHQQIVNLTFSSSYSGIHQNTIHECSQASRNDACHYILGLPRIAEYESGQSGNIRHPEIAIEKVEVTMETGHAEDDKRANACMNFCGCSSVLFSAIFVALLWTFRIVQRWCFKLRGVLVTLVTFSNFGMLNFWVRAGKLLVLRYTTRCVQSGSTYFGVKVATRKKKPD